MSSWLFNVHMDGVLREVNARVFGIGPELARDAQKFLRSP